MSRLSLLPFPPQNQPAPPSNCPAQTEPSRRKLPALQGLAVLSRLRRVSAPCTTAISFPLARLAAKMLCRSWSHLFFFFFWGGGRPCFPTPVHASCLGSTVSGAEGGTGPAPGHPALRSPRRDLWVAAAGPSPRAAGHRDRWPQSRQASSRRDRGTSPLHPLLNKQEFFRYSSLRKTKLFPFSSASGLRCSSTRAIIRRGFASPGRDSG